MPEGSGARGQPQYDHLVVTGGGRPDLAVLHQREVGRRHHDAIEPGGIAVVKVGVAAPIGVQNAKGILQLRAGRGEGCCSGRGMQLDGQPPQPPACDPKLDLPPRNPGPDLYHCVQLCHIFLLIYQV